MKRAIFPAAIALAALAAGLVHLGAAPQQAGSAKPAVEAPSAPSADAAPSALATHQALIDQYCVVCHNQSLNTGGLALDKLDLAHVGQDAEMWEEVVRKLRAHMMPPPGMPQPDQADVDSFIPWLEASLDQAAAANPNPGYVALHRLNRAEYENAIEEILGMRVDASSLLPVDDISDGFDNIASVLKVSPSFLDQYISAARFVTAKAIGSPAPASESVTLQPPPGTDQGQYVEGLPLGTRGGFVEDHVFPADGEYEFSFGSFIGAGYVQGMEYRHKAILTLDGVKVYENEVGGEDDLKYIDQKQAPAVADVRSRFEKIRVPVTAGPHKVGVTFVARAMSESDDILQSFVPGRGENRIPKVRSIDVVGPRDATGIGTTPSRSRVFVCRPSQESEERPCASQILSHIARQAFRRPATERDLAAPLAFFEEGRKRGGFETGIQDGLMAILASPKFLYRAEKPPADLAPGSTYQISDLDLASRLSFFLWSQNPDDELIDLAVDGKLSEPAVLERQVKRMLADPRSHSLVTNFAFQWLNLRALDDIDPDPVQFPNYDPSLGAAFLEELELFIQSIIDDDRSVVDLLTANHTFVNERLALHYGIPNVHGARFRRVTLADRNRWGLLGKGGVLMVTSYPNRTAPVLRGAWILERLLGTPPPTPPPDVEAFPETKEGEKALSVRERLEQHRQNPSCNACHGVMDPLGFALENFDAIGGWQDVDRYAGTVIDSSGQLANGTPISGPDDLRRALTGDPRQFVQTLVEKMLMYALGRDVEHFDMPVVRQIVREAASDNYRFSTLVTGIVRSMPFQRKQISDGGEPAAGAEVAAAARP